nr:MAG TPA: hypothetical protein [Caudoviricetes sp.]
MIGLDLGTLTGHSMVLSREHSVLQIIPKLQQRAVSKISSRCLQDFIRYLQGCGVLAQFPPQTFGWITKRVHGQGKDYLLLILEWQNNVEFLHL